MAEKKYKKRRKDIKVKNSDGITRVKPVRNIGKDEKGRNIQNIAIKRADGSVTTDRYADGEKIGSTYQPKVLRKKKIKKLKVNKRLPRKLKTVTPPAYTAPEVTLDAETQEIYEKRKKIKERKKRIAEKKKNRPVTKKVTDAVKKGVNKVGDKVKKVFKRRPKARKVRNLVTGGTNILR